MVLVLALALESTVNMAESCSNTNTQTRRTHDELSNNAREPVAPRVEPFWDTKQPALDLLVR